MAWWVRALAAQARVVEVRCQSPSNKQGPAHSAAAELRQVETGGGLAHPDCQLKRTCKLQVQQRGFAPKKQGNSEKTPTPWASTCSRYAAHTHTHITAATEVWMEIFCMGGQSSSQKTHVWFTWKSQFRVFRELLTEETPMAHKQLTLLPLLSAEL